MFGGWRNHNATRGDLALGLLIVAVLWGVLLAAVVWTSAAEDRRQDEARAQQTLLGCQRGNELRRAIASLEAEFERKCPLCRQAQVDVDEDAKAEDNCRAVVRRINGVDLGPMAGGPPPDPFNYVQGGS